MQRDERLLSHKKELANYLALLKQEAEAYFQEMKLIEMDEERLQEYQIFYESYLTLQQHLSNPEALLQNNTSNDEEEKLLVTAKTLAHDTVILFRELSKKPITGDETYNPVQDRQNKVNAIFKYKEKQQSTINSTSSLKTLGHVVLGVVLGALGLVIGGVAGFAVGFFLSIAAVLPSFSIAAGFMGVTSILGSGIGGVVGFMTPWWLKESSSKPARKCLHEKADTFANHASVLFSPVRRKIHANAPQNPATNIDHYQHCYGTDGSVEWARNRMRNRKH